MRKFIKYEIKGTYRFILGLLSILLIAFTIIQFKGHKDFTNLANPSPMINPFEFIALLSILVIFGAFVTAFFYIIGSFRKELYEDRGYLTFTLPLTGNQIVGGKLLVALLWTFIIGITIVVYNLLLATFLFKVKWSSYLEVFKGLINLWGLTFSIGGIISVVLSLTIIYFSITLSKISFKNKKVGGLWFIAFLLISGVVSYIVNRVNIALPYYLDLSTFKLTNVRDLTDLFWMVDISKGVHVIPNGMHNIVGVTENMFPNIFGKLTELLISIGMFLGTSQLIEKRIDL